MVYYPYFNTQKTVCQCLYIKYSKIYNFSKRSKIQPKSTTKSPKMPFRLDKLYKSGYNHIL